MYGAENGRMGGLLIADAALDIASTTRHRDIMWPKIVAVMGKSSIYTYCVLHVRSLIPTLLLSIRYARKCFLHSYCIVLTFLQYLGLHPVRLTPFLRIFVDESSRRSIPLLVVLHHLVRPLRPT